MSILNSRNRFSCLFASLIEICVSGNYAIDYIKVKLLILDLCSYATGMCKDSTLPYTYPYGEQGISYQIG